MGRPLVGDHHVHSVYSHDAKYTFSQIASAASTYGLDWIVFTEHSNFGHANAGGASAEHATVFSPPGPKEVDLLTRFELSYDGKLLGYTAGGPSNPDTARNEAHAVAGLRWLAEQRATRYVDDVLVLANHPLRLGIDSPRS